MLLTLPERLIFALVLIGCIGWFAQRTVLLVRLIRMGADDPDITPGLWRTRLADMLLDVFLQRKVLRKPYVGSFHLLIVWGFFVFAVNTVNHFTGAFLPGFHLFGDTFAARGYAAIADLFALLIITGVVGMAVRRHVLRPPILTRPSVESAIVFTCIGGAMVAYLFAGSTKAALGILRHSEYHFACTFFARYLESIPASLLRPLAHVAWWSDALMHLALIGLLVIPTKHLHLVAGPINLLFRRPRPRGAMTRLNLEDESAEQFGVAKIEQFTWKQNLDLYACIECGRCLEYCPTALSDKPLRPKELIVDLKDHLIAHGPARVNGKGETPTLPGGVVATDVIWACTTCAACVEHCPMGIEHVDKLTDMRRHLVLMEAAFPETAETAFRQMETAGNPWGFPPGDRAAWAQDLDVATFAEKRRAEVLYWVGCNGSYDDRGKRIARAMVKILQAAGVDFAILGTEERCHCESARRLGNELLYQTAAQEIMETLKQYEFSRILVTCPHCLNTFINEYSAFDAHYRVVHHTEFIAELLDGGRLRVNASPSGRATVYHDSCYLGRYHDTYDAPRRVLATAGQRVIDPPHARERGLCCGAGGGRMWLEETLGVPINALRARELAETGAHQTAAACPFCITMLTDGMKSAHREDIAVLDIAEIIADALTSAGAHGPDGSE